MKIHFVRGILYVRAGRLTAQNGGFWPGRSRGAADRGGGHARGLRHARGAAAAGPTGRGRGGPRARSHCRFVPPLIHFIPDSLTYLVPLFLKRQCDRTLGGLRRFGGRGPGHRLHAGRRRHPRHGVRRLPARRAWQTRAPTASLWREWRCSESARGVPCSEPCRAF
jgi:hypothetical protein